MNPMLIVLLAAAGVTVLCVVLREWRAKPRTEDHGPGIDPALEKAIADLGATGDDRRGGR